MPTKKMFCDFIIIIGRFDAGANASKKIAPAGI